MKYNHKLIEKKWQKFWLENKLFKSDVDFSKPKFYILDMFPYPSGAGLHMGHVSGYTGTDVLARHYRQRGFNVLHPMGWDSFGLPAEQYAIRTGTHPAVTTEQNIKNYRRQMENLGFSYDWDREMKTSDSKYYKWTQWIFTKLFEKGLAYEAEAMVNFCPHLGTVLANEEVEDGKAKEGGYPVIKKPLKQWILKITEYAERLISDLQQVDWPENLKKLQINWIGKSEGAQIAFFEIKSNSKIEVFTTRPDTLFGATYLVLAPEHPLVSKITTQEKKTEVDDYLQKTLSKSDLERTDLAKEKSGVFIGAYVINPVSKKEIPIWISDYVLIGYGTGAIMAVPAHDERDFEFAKKFNLPITAVYEPLIDDDTRKEVLSGAKCWIENGKAVNSFNSEISLNGLDVDSAKEKMIQFLEKKSIGKRAVSYKLRDWLFSRQRYWGEPIPILHLADGTIRALELDELPLMPPELSDYSPTGTGESPLSKVTDWVNIKDPKTGKMAKRETNTMPQWAGSCWYYLRFLDPLNEKEAWGKEAEKYWMPVDLYVGGTEHAVLHLLYARFWHKVLFDFGLVSTLEPFQKYRYPGIITAPSFKKESGGYLAAEDVFEKEGAYFAKNSGEKLQYQVEKMSKSKLNGISPDEVIDEFGTDALRLYSMFMGPFDQEKVWNSDAVTGSYRFLNRFFDIATSDKICDEELEEGLKLSHKLVAIVGKDIEEMQFNTAVAHMMEFLNDFSKLQKYPKNAILMAIQVLYPFAPHICEEMWSLLGQKESLTYVPWPTFEEKFLVDKTAIYVVQINGKLRGKFELKRGLLKKELLDIALKDPQIQKFLTSPIKKVVFVPDKLLSIVL